jgi:hypothetical protein
MVARLATMRSPRRASDPTVRLRLIVLLSDGISASPSLNRISTHAGLDSSFLAQTSPKEDSTTRQGYAKGNRGPRRAWAFQP